MAKLIICIDGLGKDLLSKKNTPFLYNLGNKNYFSELESLFCFTGLEFCFFSGKNPAKSKIWFEFVRSESSIFDNKLLKIFSFNKKLRDYYGGFLQLMNRRSWVSGLHNIPSDKLKYFDTSLKQGLWYLDYFQNKSFSFYKWPFFVFKNKRNKSKIILRYEKDSERINRILKIIGVDVYYTQLMKVDKTIHRYGKKSLETKKALVEIDAIIERALKEFLKRNLNGDFFIWSDHGFADIKNYIDIEKILPKRNDYIYFIAGTSVHFWFDNNETRIEVLNVLEKIPEIKIMNNKTARKYEFPMIPEYGELVIYLEKGNYFFPNFYQKSQKERFVSMHGYPIDRELNGFLISNKKIPKLLKMSEVINYLR